VEGDEWHTSILYTKLNHIDYDLTGNYISVLTEIKSALRVVPEEIGFMAPR
jgi:hypothetical protein